MRQKGNVDYQEGSGDRCLERDLELDVSKNKNCQVTCKKLVLISTLIPLFVSSLVNVAVQLLVKGNATVNVFRDADIIDSAQDPVAYARKGTSYDETSNLSIGLVNVFLDAIEFDKSLSSGKQTTIPWDTTKTGTFISTDIQYNFSSRHFLVSISGMYELNAKLTFRYDGNATGDTTLYSTLQRSGSQITLDQFVFPSCVKTNFYHVHHDLWYMLQAGDTVSVTAPTDAMKYLDPSWRASYFGIRLIQKML